MLGSVRETFKALIKFHKSYAFDVASAQKMNEIDLEVANTL